MELEYSTDLTKLPEGFLDGLSQKSSIWQWIQKWSEKEQGTAYRIALATEYEESLKSLSLYEWKESGDDLNIFNIVRLRFLSNLLINLMPSEALEETFRELLELFEFYNIQSKNLPRQISNEYFATSITNEISEPSLPFLIED